MLTEFQVWRHKATEEAYAVRLKGNTITGCYGPLPVPSFVKAVLPSYTYDADPGRCRELEERGSEFLLVVAVSIRDRDLGR